MTTAAYIRVSTSSQDVENQRHELTRHAEALGLEIERWIEADGISSRKGYTARKIDQVLKLKRGDVLLVSELSRLARSARQVLELVEELGNRGVVTYVKKEGLRLNGGDDIATKAVVTSLGLAADIERTLISERTKAALAARKAQGKRLGMRTEDEHGNLTHDVAAIQAKAVASLKAKAQARASDLASLLASMRDRGLTQRAMVAELDRLGVSSPSGRAWSQATVCRMLKRIA